MTHRDYYSYLGDMSVEEYLNKYLRNQREINRIEETISLFPADISSVLDVGAGFGILLKELEIRRGIKGVGVEIAEPQIEYARKNGLDIREGDISNLDFPDKSFDLVVTCEVIEHLPFGIYESALSEIVRVAKKYVVISVPFEENRLFVRCSYCGSYTNPDYHMREFNKESMINLLPNSRLIKIKLIGEKFTPIFGKKILSIYHRISNYPDSKLGIPFLCPVCGHRTKPNINVSRIPKLAKKIVKKIIMQKKPIWIAALYSINKEA